MPDQKPHPIAESLRALADQIEAGDFEFIDHKDQTESVLAGVHKGLKVQVTTGKRHVTLELTKKNHRLMELAGLVDLAETAWQQTDGPKKLAVIAERIAPRARLVDEVEAPSVA